MGKAAMAMLLRESERQELEGLARRRRTAQGLARRARIVLLSAEGLQNKAIAARLGADPETVGIGLRRFAERGIDGLYDEPRPGAPRRIGDEAIAETIRKTLEETPPNATHWSLRLMGGIEHYIAATNAEPKPFLWTKPANDILASIHRFCVRTFSAADRQKMIRKTSGSGH